MSTIKVTKRDGSLENFDVEKIHKILGWAVGDYGGVSVSDIAMHAQLQLFEEIPTEEIHQVLIKSAADLVSLDCPNYQYVASKLLLYELRKKVWGGPDAPRLWDHIKQNVDDMIYDEFILEHYSKSEINKLNNKVNHDRDYIFTYSGLQQLIDKYLVKDRSNGNIYETPQFAYMLIAMTLFAKYPKQTRISYVIKAYDYFSKHKINLPTPIMAGVRTPIRQYSSCFPSGQMVWTKNGFEEIQNINPETLVMGLDGSTDRVLATREMEKENFNMISLRNQFSIANEFKCTDDHLIRCLKNWQNEVIWEKAGKINKKDFVEIPFDKQIVPKQNIDIENEIGLREHHEACSDGFIKQKTSDPRQRSGPYNDKVHPVPSFINLNENVLRFIGYYLAEGYCSDRHVQFSFCADEQDFIDDVIKISKEEFNVPCSINQDIKRNTCYISLHSRTIRDFVNYIAGTGFDTKFIHKSVMQCDPKIQQQLLIGVIRGDGCVHDNGVTLSMSNRNLVHQISHIMLRNGLFPSLFKRKPSGFATSKNRPDIITKQITYGITMGISGNYEFLNKIEKTHHIFDGMEESRLAKYIDGRYFAKVLDKKEEFIEKQLVYDLQVENQESFTVSGIGVHNCVLIDIGDSLPSIFSSTSAVGYYTARRAGIGVNIGRIRPIGSSIRNGEVIHTGVIPFLKVIESTAKSCSQNGIRGGGATVSCPWWHYEIEDVIVLKNNAGTDDNRVRKLDYCVQFEQLFYERVKENKDITLLSPEECKGLYDAFGTKHFKDVYEKYERSRSLKFKKKVKARKLLEVFLRERIETGRIYFMNIDHANQRGPWKSKVNMTNLCCEILQPTTPIHHIDDSDGEIGICTLSAINLLEIKSEEQLETSCDIVVRLLDAVLDHQDYPVKAGENFATNRRSLGVGITNLAGLLAKSKVSYDSQEALEIVDQWCENVQYYLLKASNKMAMEIGACTRFNDTKYADGVIPPDAACDSARKLVKRKPGKDWETLRQQIVEHGLRHSTVTAVMPAESSSVIQNSTNGIEPVRSLISYKKAKNGVLKQIVPGYHHYKNFYTLAWDITDNTCINNICATIQKWFDMGISMNHYYNYAHHDSDKGIPLSVLAKDLIKSHELGLRTGYYANTNDGDKSVDFETEANQQEEICAGGACSL